VVAFGVAIALGGGVRAQDIPDKPPPAQPKPPPAQPKPPQPKPPKPPEPKAPKPPEPKAPEPKAPEPPAPPPGATGKQVCDQIGGSWNGTECDTSQVAAEAARKACEQAGNVWDQAARKCSPKPTCPTGKKWNGTECVADCADNEQYREGHGCVPIVPAPPASSAPPAAITPPPPSLPPERPPGAEPASAGPWRTISIVGGGLLLGVGTVTGIVALSKKSSFSSQCNDAKQCPASAKGDYDTGRALGWTSTGTLAGGVALLALGLFVLPSGGPGEQEKAGSLTVRVGLGGVQACGRF
jgi:hypothetical protein